MNTIYEYKPTGSYKRIISSTEARKLHNQSGSEYTWEEATEIASKGGILILEDEVSTTAVGTLFATVTK